MADGTGPPDFDRWHIVRGQPDARLKPYVAAYQDYSDSSRGTRRDRHTPGSSVTVILDFGDLRHVDHGDPRLTRAYPHGFVAGLHDEVAVTETTGSSHGLQVDLTPIGAYQIFGVPMHELTNRAVALDDMFGTAAVHLADQLRSDSDPGVRFDLLDAFIGLRLAAARPPAEGIAWALHELERKRGRVSIASLTDRLGCTRKHLVAQFREQIGLPPKMLARILRFNQVVKRLERTGSGNWAATALELGYYDQSHMIRDFKEFAGSTPSDFLKRRRASGGVTDAVGAEIENEVTFVQAAVYRDGYGEPINPVKGK